MSNRYVMPKHLRDEEVRRYFLKIVLQQMEVRGFGYTALAKKIVPLDCASDLMKVTGELKRLKEYAADYNRGKIKNAKTITWLWNYFITIDTWKPYLAQFVSENPLYDVSKSIHAYYYPKDALKANEGDSTVISDGLSRLIEKGENAFIIKGDDKDQFARFLFFHRTDRRGLFRCSICIQSYDELFSSDEKNWMLRSVDPACLLFSSTQMTGMLVTKSTISSIYLSLLYHGKLKEDGEFKPCGKLINDRRQHIQHLKKEYLYEKFLDEIDNKPRVMHDIYDPFNEMIYKTSVFIAHLGDEKEMASVSTSVKSFDNINNNLL